MDITPALDGLRRDLRAAAESAGPDGEAAATRMLLALEPAVRLTALELLSQAAAEITAELPAGLVEVRLRGRDPELVVDVPAPDLEESRPEQAPEPAELEDGSEADGPVARVTLRIPEAVKGRAEERAAEAGQSLNSWVVGVLRTATARRAVEVDLDLSSRPLGPTPTATERRGGRRLTGWA